MVENEIKLTIIGVVIVAVIVLSIVAFIKWEARHATNYYKKRNKKFKRILEI